MITMYTDMFLGGKRRIGNVGKTPQCAAGIFFVGNPSCNTMTAQTLCDKNNSSQTNGKFRVLHSCFKAMTVMTL